MSIAQLITLGLAAADEYAIEAADSWDEYALAEEDDE
jgi:hypothetical protein